jgi:response regulator RpfG family c-di-GMP phosphodiesterase
MENRSPNLNLNIVIVTNQKQNFCHYLEVSEAAAEQIDCLKRSSSNRSFFNMRHGSFEPARTTVRQSISYINRDDVKATHGVLAWLTFLIKELDTRIIILRGSLDAAESVPAGNISPEKRNGSKVIRENISQLARVVEGITHLTRVEEFMADAIFEEVDVSDTLKWIMEYVRELAEQRNIEITIEKIENIGRLMVDRRDFTQGLLYIIRSEVLSGPPCSKLDISAAEINEEYISIRIVNPNHFIPQQALDMLFQGQLEGIPHNVLRNELYPAKLLLQGIGGKLTILSAEGEGTNYIVIVPKRWQSWMQEVNALQLATEISRKEARAELANIHNMLSSLVEHVPVKMKDSLDKLGSNIQELEVLCNRSLFLADDLNSRLETHQEQTQKQELDQLATSEDMAAIMRDLAGLKQRRHFFDPDSSKKVARYALAMAKELCLSESECQLLRKAATYKDLRLVSSARDMVEQIAALTSEEAAAIEARFKPMLAVLETLPFLAPVLNTIRYRYVRYDDARDNSKGNGNAIVPMVARILAVADTYESLTSGVSAQGKLSPEEARQRIVDDSGLRFDPEVVKVFSYLWKRKDLNVANNRGEKLHE